MKIQELKQTKDYEYAVDKIKKYPKNFKFTLNYSQIPKAKGNALRIITRDMIKEKILESISIGIDLQGNICEETFQRL